MYYYILFTIIIVCLLIIFVIFKKNSGKTDKLAVTEAIKEKQAQIKKRLFESKLEKKILNFSHSVLGFLNNFLKILKRKKIVKKIQPVKKRKIEMTDERALAGILLEAQANLKKRKIDEAENKFIEVLQKDPKNIESYMGLGRIYVMRKEFDTAEEAYRHIVKINRKFFNGYRELLNVFELSKNWSELKKIAQEVLDLGHQEAWVYEKIGTAFRRTGYPEIGRAHV